MAAPHQQPAIDKYTAGHAAVGVLYGLAQLPWWVAVGLAVGWELVENPLKVAAPRLFPDAKPDRLPNAATDVAAVVAGYAIARALTRRRRRRK